jgi:cation:H+ antiporter
MRAQSDAPPGRPTRTQGLRARQSVCPRQAIARQPLRIQGGWGGVKCADRFIDRGSGWPPYEGVLVNAGYFVVGLAALYFGADWLVAGAARLARRHGMTPLVVGRTVVAFASSAPELVVGIVASVARQSELVLGNVVGSNILNIALILGVAAVVRPLHVGSRILLREMPLMVAFSILAVAMVLDGAIGRGDAALLLVLFVGFIVFVLRAARTEYPAVAAEYLKHETKRRGTPTRRAWQEVGLIVAGLLGLLLGAYLLVSSSVYFARILGVSEVVIGITVVAIGTSLPELATCVVAALRSEPDIALGNAVGSNIFNLLPILGVSALVRPIPVSRDLLMFEIPAMVLFAVILLPLAWQGRVLGRGSGIILLAGYVIFTGTLAARVLG